MQIPILNGVFADTDPSLRISYPKNLIPVAQANGISNGFLRPADGILSEGTGPGVDRGGINWNGVCYRVMGSKLVSIDGSGSVTTLGEVGGTTDLVTFDYSFDRLAVASNNNLFYWDGAALTQVTDVDLGTVLDVIWIDGYFMTTDGEFLVVTELNDPTSVNPLKYGSSEIDPDPIEAILKLRNEAWALNRYTSELFNNIGVEFFPFQRREGAQIQKGCVGTHACCIYMEAIAFVGGGRNEQPGVYIGENGNANKISTLEIDKILEGYTELQLSKIKVEARNDKTNQLLYIHLPDKTIVYDSSTSQAFGEMVWFILDSNGQYKAQNFVYAYDKWLVGDPTSSNVGSFTDTIGSHWGEVVKWEFGTRIGFNETMGAIFNRLELISLTGSVELGTNPRISTSYSIDGLTWSQDKYISVGKIGNRAKRLVWLRQGFMRIFRSQRFRGDSSAHLSFLRLEATIEPLAY